MSNFEYTPEQAWVVDQFLKQQRKSLKKRFKHEFAYFRHRNKQMDATIRSLERMSEEERAMTGVWLETNAPPPF
jgi:hypothetical protein